MRHPCLTPRDAVGFKQPHLRPTQAKAIADRIVNFFGRGDAIFDQPQPFAPNRLKETIGDMCVNFFAHMQGVETDRG